MARNRAQLDAVEDDQRPVTKAPLVLAPGEVIVLHWNYADRTPVGVFTSVERMRAFISARGGIGWMYTKTVVKLDPSA